MKFSIIPVIAAVTLLWCAPVPQYEAVQAAENLIIERGSRIPDNVTVSDVIAVSRQQVDTWYLVTYAPAGFALIAADNCISPILAYSFDNDFPEGPLPPSLDQWLNGWQAQIHDAVSRNLPAGEQTVREWAHYTHQDFTPNRSLRDVPPLLPCNWNQDSPWNAACPLDPAGPGGHVYSGCVAVSMVQVMYYWEYPNVGYGSHSYWHNEYGEQFADFGNAYYDYNEMEDNVSTAATAELHYHAGVAIDMGYSPNGSGAWVGGGHYPSAFSAMTEHFLFDEGQIDWVEREDWNDSDWAILMQTECDNNRPVIYRGYGSGGHAFNLDGYQGDEHFHFNWGWGGAYNGYFHTGNLNPGGSHFNEGQAAIIGLIPLEVTHPRVVLRDYSITESGGDSDLVINPGESAEVLVQIENLYPFGTAFALEMELVSLSESITVSEEYLFAGDLQPAEQQDNNDLPFVLNIDPEIFQGTYYLELNVSALTSDSDIYTESFQLQVSVSLNQAGYPALPEAQVESSPLVLDIDNDGSDVEIVFGDYEGRVHVLHPDGSEREGWPFETGDQIWASPAIADIDLDGSLEIVIGSKSKHVFVLEIDGSVQTDYYADQFTMGTPALGNLDEDPELEIVFGGFSNPGQVFAINPDGSDVPGFPLVVDEKIQRGIALTDLNGNGQDDLVFGTDDANLYLVYDDGSVADGFPFAVGDKIRTAPTVLHFEGSDDFLILVGSKDDVFYAITDSGDLHFSIPTGGDIESSVSVIEDPGYGPMLFFGSSDGFLYGVFASGIAVPGFPVNLNHAVTAEPIFTDLDGDNEIELVVGTTGGSLWALHLDGSVQENFPISVEFGVKKPVTVADIDNDDDLEIIAGTMAGLSVVDYKLLSSDPGLWQCFRGSALRSGVAETSFGLGCSSGIVGDMNCDYGCDVIDLIILVNAILDGDDLSGMLTQADANFDGAVDILDVVTLASMIIAAM